MTASAPPSNTITESSSIAADLAAQFEKLYEARQEVVLDPRGISPAVPFLLAPAGMKATSLKSLLDEFLPHPTHRKGTAQLRDMGSFIDHVKRFQTESTAVFASPDRRQPSLTAVYDYHDGVELEGDNAKPGWMQHRAVYACPVSDAWAAWAKVDGQPMGQGEFAAFLEDRLGDVMLPPSLEDDADLRELVAQLGGRFAGSTALMELARGLAINVDTKIRQAVTLGTGEISIVYDETHKDGEGAPVRTPNLFLLAIPVFYSGATYRIPVRLRYRVKDGKVIWAFHLYRADRAFDDAFADLTRMVRDETGLPVFLGTPEA